MRGHVVGAFLVMLVRTVFGRDAREIRFEVAPRGRSRILLNDQRGRGVAGKNR
jgi:hypothetical protein